MIPPPARRRQLVTLEDAGNYITDLPAGSSTKANRDRLPDWRRRGPRLFDACAHRVLRALNRHVERVFNPDRKDTHWGSAS